MKMKTIIILSLASVLNQSCNASTNKNTPENNSTSNVVFVEKDSSQFTDEISQKEKSLSILFEISLKKGGLLELTREDNYEYPVDFTSNSHQVAILSGVEKKVVIYDYDKKEFIDCSKINVELSKQFSNQNIVASTPLYIRFVEEFIAVIYLNKFMLFDRSFGFISSLNLDKQVSFSTVDGSKLLFWHKDAITVVDFTIRENNTYVLENEFHNAGIFSGYGNTLIVNSYDNYFIYEFDYSIKRIIDKKSSFPFSKLPEVKKESVSLDCVTNSEYVWYLWQNQNEIVLEDRFNGVVSKVSLGLDITKDNLFYEEDIRSGFRVSSFGNTLFFMVMKNDNGIKKLKVYFLEK
jgi:hypothetical protein